MSEDTRVNLEYSDDGGTTWLRMRKDVALAPFPGRKYRIYVEYLGGNRYPTSSYSPEFPEGFELRPVSDAPSAPEVPGPDPQPVNRELLAKLRSGVRAVERPAPVTPAETHVHTWVRCENCPNSDGPCACAGGVCCSAEQDVTEWAVAVTTVGGVTRKHLCADEDDARNWASDRPAYAHVWSDVRVLRRAVTRSEWQEAQR